MKKFLVILGLFVGIISTFSQICNPAANCVNTICPDTLTVFTPVQFTTFSQTITMNVADSVSNPSGAGKLKVDSVVITNVTGLPTGITWATTCGTTTSCTYHTGANCILLSGTPPSIGTYTLSINTVVHVTYLGSDVASPQVARYIINTAPVCNPNATCVNPLCPDTLTVFNAIQSVQFSQTITMNVDSIPNPFGGKYIQLDSIVIKNVTGLPLGITWYTSCGKTTICTYYSGGNCILLSGSATTIATYTVAVSAVTYYGAGSTLPYVAHYIINVTGLPAVTTTAALSITTTTATSGGNVTTDGGTIITARGVVWGSSPNPTISSPNSITGGTGIGTFVGSITGLTPSTVYYIRAYATNTNGMVYGNDVTFTTSAPIVPVITTMTVNIINTTTAKSVGVIANDGSSFITARGIVWSTLPAPTVTLTTIAPNGSDTGSYTCNLTGLKAGTVYYVRAYATNANGTFYGNQVAYVSPAPLNCTSDTSITLATPGIFPKTIPPLDSGNYNVDQTFTYSIPFQYTNAQGQLVDIDSSHLDAVLNLPQGLSLQCGRPSCMYYPGEISCFTISGTLPKVNGQTYTMQFQLTDYGTVNTSEYGPQFLQTYSPHINDTVAISVSNNGAPLGIEPINLYTFNVVQYSPNPFNNVVTIIFTTPVNGNFKFYITDMVGREIYNTSINASPGLNTFNYSANEMASGAYYFTISNGNQNITKKMIAIKQ